MLKYFITTLIFFTFTNLQGQVDQSTPESTMAVVFKAAKTRKFSNLSTLCSETSDGDTRMICSISNANKKEKKEFRRYFKKAYISGEVVYTGDGEKAQVPFWFSHPGSEDRCFETMNMVKINGLWYLDSF